MEHAEYIKKKEDLNKIAANITRIYYGNEFCENLIPEEDELKQIYEECKCRGLNFTYRTPFLTVKGLERFCRLVDYIIVNKLIMEIVINDWGILRYIKENNYHENNGIKLVLGRLLSRQKTDIMTGQLKSKIPDKIYDHFCTPVAASKTYFGFIKEYGIERIEIENVPHEIVINNEVSDIFSFSLLYPWISVSSTRICPTSIFFGQNSDISIQKCNKQCLDNEFIIDDEIYGRYFCKGNSLFYKNDILPQSLEIIGVDRLVNDSGMDIK